MTHIFDKRAPFGEVILRPSFAVPFYIWRSVFGCENPIRLGDFPPLCSLAGQPGVTQVVEQAQSKKCFADPCAQVAVCLEMWQGNFTGSLPLAWETPEPLAGAKSCAFTTVERKTLRS
jgi:hypothetical protein